MSDLQKNHENPELVKNNQAMFTRLPSVADMITEDLFEKEEKSSGGNELLELVQHVQNNGVPLTEDQVQANFLLHEMGLGDIAQYSMAIRPQLTPMSVINKLIDKITLADRIKGTAKLGNLLKAQVANPSNTMPNAKDLQAKPMVDKEFTR